MKSKISPLKNLPIIHKSQIEKLDDETLLIIFKDREKTLEYAKKSIMTNEPENLNGEYIQKVTDGMQVLARMVLEERGILTKS